MWRLILILAPCPVWADSLVATRVIRAPYAALTGAAHALDTPFAVGFDSRAPLCASTPPLA